MQLALCILSTSLLIYCQMNCELVEYTYLIHQSAATLVHAFVTSRVDQCNAVLAGATKSVTDTLQRVMNAAARVVSDTRPWPDSNLA